MNNVSEVTIIKSLIDKGEVARLADNPNGLKGSILAGPMTGFRTASLSFIAKYYGQNHPYYIEFEKSTKSKYISNCEEGIEILKSILDEVNTANFSFPLSHTQLAI